MSVIGSNKALLAATSGAVPVDNSWNLLAASETPANLAGTPIPNGGNNGNLAVMRMSSDGTKAIGWDSYSGSIIHSYTFSTAWDTSTIAYAGFKSLGSGGGHAFDVKPDGTRLYVSDAGSSEIHEFSMGTAWDVSTATYLASYTVSGGPFNTAADYSGFTENNYGRPGNWGIVFKDDGTKVFLGTGSGSTLVSFDLTTAWDLSTLTPAFSGFIYKYAPENNSYSGQLWVSADGTKAFLQGNGSGYTTRYDLDTANDVISGGTFYRGSIGASYGLFVKPDGTQFYSTNAGTNAYTIVAFDMSPAWNVSGVTYRGYSASYNTATLGDGVSSTVYGLYFTSDGLSCYVLKQNKTVYQYSLSTAWDITTMSYTGKSALFASYTFYDIWFSSDGTQLYASNTTEYVSVKTLGTAWDVSTAGAQVNQGRFNHQDGGDLDGIAFSADGTRVFFYRSSTKIGAQIAQYDLSTAWDMSSWTAPSNQSGLSYNTGMRNITIGDSGTKLYGDYNGPNFYYTFGTAWDIDTISSNTYAYRWFPDSRTESVAFKPDGTRVFFAGTSLDSAGYLYSQDLSPAWNFPNGRGVSPQTNTPFLDQGTGYFNYSGALQNNGTVLLQADSGGNAYAYTLSTAYDLMTATLASSKLLGQSGTGHRFSDSGTKLFCCSGGAFRTFSLATAWDVSTATYDGYVNLPDWSLYMNNPYGLWFADSGTSLFLVNASNPFYVVKWALSTPYDASTATLSQTFNSYTSSGNTMSGAYSLAFNPDGTRMYMGYGSRRVYQFSLSTAFDLTTATYDGVFTAYSGPSSTFFGIMYDDTGTNFYLQSSNRYIISVPI